MAERLGLSLAAESLLLRKASRLQREYPSSDAESLEDWLLDLANVRGADVVSRRPGLPLQFRAPSEEEFSNEELCAALCHPAGRDRPHILRAAGQLVSRGDVRPKKLHALAVRERIEPVFS